MRTIKTYTKIEICEQLGITEAQFRHAKEALKFTHVDKDARGILLYPESVIAAITAHRSALNSACKGATPDMFRERKQNAVTLEDVMEELKRLKSLIEVRFPRSAEA
jgi:hypothetical protein